MNFLWKFKRENNILFSSLRCSFQCHLVCNILHCLAEHVVWCIHDGNVVTERLTHLLFTVDANQERAEDDGLRFLAVLLHKRAPDEVVELLVIASDLDVALDLDRVHALAKWIEDLVHGDGLVSLEPLGEVIALHDARHGVAGTKADHVLKRHLAQPVLVVVNLSLLRIKDLVDLAAHGVDVRLNFFSRELLSGLTLATGIADLSGEITDDEARDVAHFLEVTELSKNNRPAQSDVLCGGIDAELDAESLAFLYSSKDVLLANDFRGSTADRSELGVKVHGC